MLGLLTSTQALAWGANGHRIVARIAENLLSPTATSAVRDLIGPETLVDVANWADEIRSDLRWRHASPWHYVNIPDGKTYESSAKNPDGDIIQKLHDFVATLRDPNRSSEDKQVALKWLVHLVGDVHQPLHVGRKEDRGGNSIRVEWFGESKNLHSVWDSSLIESQKLSFSEYAGFIDAKVSVQVEPPGQPDIIRWVNESISHREAVYEEPAPGSNGTYRYIFRKTPLLETRLKQAGLRLAQTLNDIFGPEIRKVARFTTIADSIETAGIKHGPENVLLVFDIDSTLLAMNQDLGSDPWFKWQESLPEDSPQRVASDFAGLLRVQGLLYAIAGMKPTETDLPERLSAWQRQGFQTMALTARGYDYRDATRRELIRNGFKFSPNPSFPPSELGEPFYPYRPATVSALGLPTLTAQKLSQRSPRLVTFAEGVFMSAGQDKGVMLRRVLSQSRQNVAAIVFVDDGDNNVVNMRNAFSSTSIDLHLFDYTGLDTDTEAFLTSPTRQESVTRQWNTLKNTISGIFIAPTAIEN